MPHTIATSEVGRAAKRAHAVRTGEPLWADPDRSGQPGGRSALEHKRVLVVEDEFLLADEIAEWLSARGAQPVGPAGTIAAARRLLGSEPQIDAAILDISLRGELVFPVALDLHERGIPLLFASAYATEVEYPPEVKDKPRLGKPFAEAQLIDAVERLLGGPAGPKGAA